MKIQKKIIALAIASALIAPALALADSANVNFYGVLDADVESVQSDKVAATASDSRGRITSNASRLGLKGSDDLGDGLQAIYQVETRMALAGGVNATNGGTANTTTSGSDGGASGVFDGLRNTNLGLTGGFGTVFLGYWDTPFKTSHNKVELFDNSSIATATALLGNNQGANAFNLRQNSSVQYWTPVMSGFQIKGAYSTVNSVGSGSNQGTPNLISLSAAYDQGPIYVALANEQHKNFAFTGAAFNTASFVYNENDKATRLVGAYTVDSFQVGLTYETMTIDTGLVNGSNKRNAYALSGKYNLPVGTIAASYTKAGDAGAAVNTGAKQLSLRYGYMMSKRTELYGMYTQISNDTAGTYNFVDIAPVTSLAGAKLSGYGVGVRHTF